MECNGGPEYVIVNGRVCVDEGQVKAVQGYGRFLETAVFPPFVYNPDEAAKIVENIEIGNQNGNDVSVNNKLGKVKKINFESYRSLIDLFVQINLEDKVCATPTLPESAVGTPSCRGPRPEGQRNIQDSTFSISGECCFLK